MTMTLELDAETVARMRPIWAAADHALRRDPMLIVDLAGMAAEAAVDLERRAERAVAVALETPKRASKGRRPVLSPEERAERQREAQRAKRAARSPEEVAAHAARQRARRAARSPEVIEAERKKARKRFQDRYANDAEWRDAAIARSKARHAAKVANKTPNLDDLLRSGAID